MGGRSMGLRSLASAGRLWPDRSKVEMCYAATATTKTIQESLGPQADYLLSFSVPKISRERLHLPGSDIVDRIYSASDRNNRVLINLELMFKSREPIRRASADSWISND